MRNSTSKAIVFGFALALCLGLAGAADAKPPKGGNGGGGKPGKGGGKTALEISFECQQVLQTGCADPIRDDGQGSYRDGEQGVQAFLNAAGEEIVFNTGKIADERDVHWTFAGGVTTFDGQTLITMTEGLSDPNVHRTLLDIGRNKGVDIRGLRDGAAPVAIDMFGDLSVNLSGRKKDATSIFSRFEADGPGGGGQRCEPGAGGTDVKISCVGEDDDGSCTEWVIDGTEPAVACVFAVFPGSSPRGNYELGPFKIRATVK